MGRNLDVPAFVVNELVSKAQQRVKAHNILKPGQHAKALQVRLALEHFYENFPEKVNYSSVVKIPSSDKTIDRLLRTNKASPELCNLIALFLTNGQHTWESYLTTQPGDETAPDTSRSEVTIIVPQRNDPNFPEFPPAPVYTPQWPASRLVKLHIEGFSDVWIKDESTNPTGTHKDRMAWEITILSHKHKWREVSLITAGSAGIAIQHFFNLFSAPTILKTLVDRNIRSEIKEKLASLGARVYEHDLSAGLLSSDEIMEITEIRSGRDLTYVPLYDEREIVYYDWMSYEIINTQPDYCFIPFGTGDLYNNVLNIVEKEYKLAKARLPKDLRFSGDLQIISNCNFLGATTARKTSRMDKLFSYYLPNSEERKDRLKRLIQQGVIGAGSDIVDADDAFVDEALRITQAHHVDAEPSGLAGLALFLKMKDQIPGDKRVVIVNTGKTRMDIQKAQPIAFKINFEF
ncbi:MAG: PLP-dependent lyase/thiolase [Cyclobacteriaceae bacterium]